MSKERRHWTSDDKIKLLRRHLIEKVPISKICDEARLAPSMFHRWQEQLFVNAALHCADAGRVCRGSYTPSFPPPGSVTSVSRPHGCA